MSREVKLSLKQLYAAVERGVKRGQNLVKVAQSGLEAVRKIRTETRYSKAELQALRNEQAAAQKNRDLLKSAQDAFARKAEVEAADAKREAKRARAAARAVSGAAYKDSRIDPRGIYATIGNHREKIPSLFRALSNPAQGFATGISVFGEGIAGLTTAAPFMAFAGGILALLQPVLEERDKLQKERILAEVELRIAQAQETFQERFQESTGFAGIATNRFIDDLEKNRADLAKGGWVSRGDVPLEGF